MSQTYLKLANDLITKHKYFILGKSWCPDVKYALSTFEAHGLKGKFYVYELDKLPDQKEAAEIESAFTNIVGKKWVPAIFVEGKYWGNEQTLKQLSASDELENTLAQWK